MSDRVVVAGAGLAALRAAESLRRGGFAGEIVIFGDEAVHPYNRPPLTKDVLSGGQLIESLFFRRRPTIDDVSWHLAEPVCQVDPVAGTVTTAERTLSYDALIVATGVRARRLDLPGSHLRHTLRRIADLPAIAQAMGPGVRVLVIGGGFLGAEAAASAQALGCQVTIVEFATHLLGPVLGERIGVIFTEEHQRRGVDVRTGTTVAAVEGEGPFSVLLGDGSTLVADLILEAVGSEPNVDLLGGCAADTSHGVLTDATLAVAGLERVAAAGDVARYPNPMFDDVARRIEHWGNAGETGAHAARTVLAWLGGDEPQPIDTVPTAWTDQYDLHLQIFGIPSLGMGEIELASSDDDHLLLAYRREGVVAGAALLGNVEHISRAKALVGSTS